MKLNDSFKFESLQERNKVIASVLAYFAFEINARDTDYSEISKYKNAQVKRMLGDNYDVSPADLMMYLTLPIDVEDINTKPNFGIRTSGELPNGRINMHLTNKILFDALFGQTELLDRIFEEEPLILTNQGDYLDYISTSLLKEPALLYYLFFTGRGEDFNNIFGNPALLKSFEDGTFDGDAVVKKMTGFKKGKEYGSPLLKSFVEKDLVTIQKMNNKLNSNTLTGGTMDPSDSPVKRFN